MHHCFPRIIGIFNRGFLGDFYLSSWLNFPVIFFCLTSGAEVCMWYAGDLHGIFALALMPDQFPVFSGCGSEILFKYPDEIVAPAESHFAGDFFNGQVRMVFEQCSGADNFDFEDKLFKGEFFFRFKGTG